MHLYGVFWEEQGRGKWGLTTNRRSALAAGRRHQALVTRYKGPKYRWRGSWDAPTLRVLSEPIADFTGGTNGSERQS